MAQLDMVYCKMICLPPLIWQQWDKTEYHHQCTTTEIPFAYRISYRKDSTPTAEEFLHQPMYPRSSFQSSILLSIRVNF